MLKCPVPPCWMLSLCCDCGPRSKVRQRFRDLAGRQAAARLPGFPGHRSSFGVPRPTQQSLREHDQAPQSWVTHTGTQGSPRAVALAPGTGSARLPSPDPQDGQGRRGLSSAQLGPCSRTPSLQLLGFVGRKCGLCADVRGKHASQHQLHGSPLFLSATGDSL